MVDRAMDNQERTSPLERLFVDSTNKSAHVARTPSLTSTLMHLFGDKVSEKDRVRELDAKCIGGTSTSSYQASGSLFLVDIPGRVFVSATKLRSKLSRRDLTGYLRAHTTDTSRNRRTMLSPWAGSRDDEGGELFAPIDRRTAGSRPQVGPCSLPRYLQTQPHPAACLTTVDHR